MSDDEILHVYYVKKLLRDYASREFSHINEHSGDIMRDYKKAYMKIEEYAMLLSLPWQDDYIPAYIRDRLEQEDL